MQGRHGHLSREQKQLAIRLHSKGWRLIDIAREVGCTAPMVGKMAREGRHLDAKPFGWEPREGRLTVLDREQILVGLARGDTLTVIARGLGRAVSTVSREVKRGGGRDGYSAWRAHEDARERARRPKPFKFDSGRIPGMVMISERLAEVEDRAVPGHWEGDLIMGEQSRSAVGTLVERSTRLTLLLHLGEGKSAEQVEVAMREAITALPASMRRTITWDQGAEMAKHAEFTLKTGIPIYFCDPHSPWQRGSNENTNGLLRQYLPKSTDLSLVSRAELDRIQDSLNGRPRKTLGYMTPSEKFAELVATTA